MKFFAVCVRDSAADAYHAPLCFPALGMAERWFRDECRSTGELAKHPEDYELFLVGTFDSDTGDLISDGPRRLLCRGIDSAKSN